MPRGGDVAGGPARVDVEIRDGRSAGLPGWRECGFELVGHRSAMRDWTDDDEIAGVHYPEVEELARQLTGCDRALVSDHVKRNAEPIRRHREQSPVRLVHSDFAANYDAVVRDSYRDVHGRGAAALARSGVSADQIESAPRIVMLQIWRNLGAPRMDLPVAFCDARTVSPEDARPFRYSGYVAGGRSFDALAIVAPDDPATHGWYAFPDLTPDEVVAFRTYDTELVREGRTWFTPHSAFRDPAVDEGRPSRFSIEIRIICLFTSGGS
ncbi:MAG TPA: CmcJ/NvfI family oxidoreductase [Acidimicrobiales bacterium]|nr:CmcJ/NvfI family oxidoreductase [Acidimicrobiales bacterium]